MQHLFSHSKKIFSLFKSDKLVTLLWFFFFYPTPGLLTPFLLYLSIHWSTFLHSIFYFKMLFMITALYPYSANFNISFTFDLILIVFFLFLFWITFHSFDVVLFKIQILLIALECAKVGWSFFCDFFWQWNHWWISFPHLRLTLKCFVQVLSSLCFSNRVVFSIDYSGASAEHLKYSAIASASLKICVSQWYAIFRFSVLPTVL